MGAIGEDEKAQLARPAADLVPRLELGYRAEGPPEARLEVAVIGDLGLEEPAAAERPVLLVQLDRDAVGEALLIGGIVPGAGLPQAPIEEGGARVMRILVVVEDIGDGEFSGGHGDARYVDRAGET